MATRRWIAILAFATLLVAGCGRDLREESRRRQCRANMNALATEQALYKAAHQCWADSVSELDDLAGRSVPLVCPSCNSEYTMSADEAGYAIECPNGDCHGTVVNGAPSWQDEQPRARRST